MCCLFRYLGDERFQLALSVGLGMNIMGGDQFRQQHTPEAANGTTGPSGASASARAAAGHACKAGGRQGCARGGRTVFFRYNLLRVPSSYHASSAVWLTMVASQRIWQPEVSCAYLRASTSVGFCGMRRHRFSDEAHSCRRHCLVWHAALRKQLLSPVMSDCARLLVRCAAGDGARTGADGRGGSW